MRRLFSLATSLVLCWLGAQAQGDRFVCDESCDPGIGGVAAASVRRRRRGRASWPRSWASIKSASSPSKAGRPVRSEYYNMQGQRNPYRRGAYIRRDTYGNGSSQSQKLFEKSSNSTNNSIEK